VSADHLGRKLRLNVILPLAALALVTSTAGAHSSAARARVEVAPHVYLNVIEAGAATARSPLVFIPGWSAGADIWKAQIAAFARNRRVIAFDPRSQGNSTKTTDGNTPETRAVDLHALLQKRGIMRPVLIGWSQGVQDVAAYVAKFGSKDLAGIVLVDSTISQGARAITASPADAAQTFERLAVYQDRQEEYLRGMFGFIIGKPQPDGATEKLIVTGLQTPPTIGAAMLVADLYGQDRSAALNEVSVPVLVIAAGNSPELDAQRSMAAKILGARFEVIDDASHAVFLDQPERFRTILAAFLEHIPRDGAAPTTERRSTATAAEASD
jgi:non-heme chloroperoxidase